MKWLNKLKSRLLFSCLSLLFRPGKTEASSDFYEAAALLYQSFFAEGKDDDIPFYISHASREGGPVLDAACGDARVMGPLAENGHTVFGFDNSGSMLNLARKNIEGLSPETKKNLHLCRASMENIPFREKFRLAIIPYNSFNHLLTAESQKKCLDGIFHSLAPGGLLIMEILPFHQKYYEGIRMRRSGFLERYNIHAGMYSRVTQDTEHGTHTVTWYIVERPPEGRPRRFICDFTRKDIRVEDMRSMLKVSGFSVEGVSASFRHKKDDNKCIILARKPDNPN
ncbi:class I SAM-dependent methyltransferase [candidate division KSB1 bacterium]